MEEERKEYANRLEEISEVAARVPLMERELQIAREELRYISLSNFIPLG